MKKYIISQTILVILIIIGMTVNIRSSTKKNIIPKIANSKNEIVTAINPLKGFGPLQQAYFSNFGRQLFFIWYCPFSGRAACYIHGYFYDPNKNEWRIFLDDFIKNTSDLEVRLPAYSNAIIIYNELGKELKNISIKQIPAKEWNK